MTYLVFHASPVEHELKLPLAREALSCSDLADMVDEMRPVPPVFAIRVVDAEENERAREPAERSTLPFRSRRGEHSLAGGMIDDL